MMGGCLGRGSGIDNCGPAYLFFDGAVSRYVDCGSPAQLDDLPLADFTVDGWILANGYGGGNYGRWADKSNAAPAGWSMGIGITPFGFFANANHAVTIAQSRSDVDDLSPDGLWHHVAAVWDVGTLTFSLFVDGAEVSYQQQQAGAGAYAADNALAMRIGNSTVGNTWWDGNIGWLRISDTQRWTSDFTPPARCTLPAIDGDTIFLEVHEGFGAKTYNLAGDYGHGDLNDLIWGCDCDLENDPTCDNEVYVANKSNYANITHAFWYDNSAAAFSPNLQSLNLPEILLPPVPAANDYLYIGSDTSILNTGPFVSLVFDIGTAAVNFGAADWEYWNGAWVNIPAEQDNTNAFADTGVNSIHWEQPSDWVTTTVNGVTGYWVRVTGSFPGAATPPYQVNRHIYTITWPHIEIAADQLTGDLDKQISIQIDNESDASAGIGAPPFNPELWANRVLVGTRSNYRGTDYTPFINVASVQNNADITVASLTARTTSAGDGPADNHYLYNPAAAVVALTDEVQIDLGDTISPQYRGRFQLFLRVFNDTSVAGNPDDFQVQVRMVLGDPDGLATFTSETITTTNENTPELIYLGFLEIPDNNYTNGIDWSNLTFYIKIAHTVALASTLTLYDLILFPVDEWAGNFTDPYWETSPVPGCMGGQETSDRTRLLIDSITNPKRHTQALLLNKTTEDEILSLYQHSSNSKASLGNLIQTGTHSKVRLFFLFESATFDPGSLPDTLYFASKYEVAARIQLHGVSRYLSMRGDR